MTRPSDTTGDEADILTPKGRSWLVLLVGLIAVAAVVYAVVDTRRDNDRVSVGPTAGATQSAPDTAAADGSSTAPSTSNSGSTERPSGQASASSTTTTMDIDGCMSLLSDLTVATIPTDDLPPEAFDTLAFILSGPPFPYDADGSVFQNREQLLPLKERGYYREFTVVTPGSSDRGARRIVAGECGERWYTDDHYSSFRLIEGP